MVAIALDSNVDIYSATGNLGNILNPISFNRVLNKDQLEELKSFNLFQGSGGTVSNLNLISLTGSKTEIQVSKQETLDKVVKEIMSTFDLTKEEQSSVFKVSSRKTLYNWIDGITTPRKTAMNRIFELLIIARDWKSSGLIASPESLRKPVVKKKSVLGLLSEDTLNREQILFAGSRLKIFIEEPKTISNPFS